MNKIKIPNTGVYNPNLFYRLESLNVGDSFITMYNDRVNVFNYNRSLKYKIVTRKISNDLMVVLRQK